MAGSAQVYARVTDTMHACTRVKICGVTTDGDRDAAIRAGADAVGFIADVPVETPRELAPETAAELVDGVAPFVTSVLVTMPGSVRDAVTLQERVAADVVQVHGTLDPPAVDALGARLDAPVLAAVEATDGDIEAYAAGADGLLVDSAGREGGGGTGETHDWRRTREYVRTMDVPIVLAGGLTPDNVARAVRTVQPFGVDVASGVEREGGRKDHEALAAFVAAARNPEVTTHPG